ncbi:MAG: alanine racemase [Oscillospiraceae bacterium]|nr:alanine racemase [Oscillospiraceae bacterium]
MCHSNYLEISRTALRHNAAAVCKAVRVPIIGIVKCNGYGVTICEAAAAWRSAGVTMFGVSRPEEALELRKNGFYEDILLLSPVADAQTLTEMLDNDVILTVSGFENAKFYCNNAYKKPIRVHVAVDTGMGRFGIRWSDTAQAKAVYSLSELYCEGIFSHFSSSFEPKYRKTKIQFSRFLSMTEALSADGISVGMRHIANSCAALRFPETHLDAVRIGSALVGKLPVTVPVKLESVSIFKAQIVDLKDFQPGDTTGYGSYFKITRPIKAAVVALGREDGFGSIAKPDRIRFKDFAAYLFRLFKEWRNPCCVVCDGQKMTVLGRIGNQYTLFDATEAEIKLGDLVEWNGNLMLSSCERRFI